MISTAEYFASGDAMRRIILTLVIAGCMCATALAEELDYYRHLRYPSKLVPGVGLDKVEQEGGSKAASTT